MSFCHPSSVDRDALREQHRQARLAQLADIKDEKPQSGLFGEPIKVAPSSDDPLGKRIKKTLGEYNVMKETISLNPKNLIGITRQPPTPGPNSKIHHDPPLFPSSTRPPHHNGQSRTTAPSTSRSVSRDPDSSLLHDRVRSNEFARPKAVVPSSSSSSTSTKSTSSSLHLTLDSSRTSPIKSESQKPLHQQHHSVAGKREPVSPIRERTTTTSSREPAVRDRSSQAAHQQHQNTNHYHHSTSSNSSKNQSASDGHHRRPNGLVLNGGIKHESSSSSSSVAKLNLRVNIENQVKTTQDSAEVENILKEMIAPTPLSGIPTPRKQPPDSKFPFPVTANQTDGHLSHSKTKGTVNRTLDLSSVAKMTPGSALPHSAGILKEDLAISDSDDDLGHMVRKGPNVSSNARSSGSAVLTNPPPPLAAMSPNSDSSSSESEGSSSGSDTEENSNKSHESEASDAESRPESPKPDQIWNLDNFIKSSSQPVPFGLPSNSLANLDPDDSRTFETRLCSRSTKDNETGGGFGSSSMPDIMSRDFTKEDIKILIASPPPVSRESFASIGKGNDGRGVVPVVDDGDGNAISRMWLPVSTSPARSQPLKRSKHGTGSGEARPHAASSATTAASSSTPTSSSKDKGKKYSSSKHVKDIFVKKNGLLCSKGASGGSAESVSESSVSVKECEKKTKSLSVPETKPSFSSETSSKKRPSVKSSSSRKSTTAASDSTKGGGGGNSSPAAFLKRSSTFTSSSTSVPSVVVTSPARSASSSADKSEKPSLKMKENSNSGLTPAPSRHIKKSVHEKRSSSKAQVSQKLFKSKEYISDTGDSSDSESEIVDVVGTPSPLKLARKTAAPSSSGMKNAELGSGSKPSSPFAPPPVRQNKSSHHSSSSKTKETNAAAVTSKKKKSMETLTVNQNKPKRPSSNSRFSSSSSSSSCEDLSSKMVPLSPIRDRLPSNKKVRHSSSRTSSSSSSSTPSLMVHLDISLLDRVPPYPRVIGRLCDAPTLNSKASVKQNGNLIENKKPAVMEVQDGKIRSDGTSSSSSSKRKSSNGGVAPIVDKKRKLKPSKSETGSTSSSSKGGGTTHKSSRSSSDIGDKVAVNYGGNGGGGLNKDKSASIEQRVSDFSPSHAGRTERKVDRTKVASTSSSSKDKSTEVSNGEAERVLLDVPISSRMPREREIQLPTRDEPPPPPLPPQPPPPSICSVNSEYESRATLDVGGGGGGGGSRARSPASCNDDLVCGGSATPSRSPGDVQGPSSESGVVMVTDKAKYRIKKERSEPEFKRRKADATASSQSCSKWEPPKMSGIDGIERNTNHDRIPVARVRPNTDFISNPKRKFIELNEKLSSPYYLEEAKKLKHEADRENDRTRQSMLYVEAILYFILTGEAMEREQGKDIAISMMFCQSIDLIKYVAANNKLRHQTVLLNETICTRLSVLSLRCQSILHLKLFNMKKKEFHECQRFLADYQKPSSSRSSMTSPHHLNGSNLTTSLWSGKSSMTGTASPMSPLPSPAGSVGSVESQSSGYSSPKVHGGGSGGGSGQHPVGGANAKAAGALAVQGQQQPQHHLQPQGHPQATITVPAQLHSVMMQQLSNYQHLSSCHEMWEQADIATVRGRSEEFFATLDQQFGKLTLHCSLRELVRYVQHGLYLLKGNS